MFIDFGLTVGFLTFYESVNKKYHLIIDFKKIYIIYLHNVLEYLKHYTYRFLGLEFGNILPCKWNKSKLKLSWFILLGRERYCEIKEKQITHHTTHTPDLTIQCTNQLHHCTCQLTMWNWFTDQLMVHPQDHHQIFLFHHPHIQSHLKSKDYF